MQDERPHARFPFIAHSVSLGLYIFMENILYAMYLGNSVIGVVPDHDKNRRSQIQTDFN